jgi:hypothetical protein
VNTSHRLAAAFAALLGSAFAAPADASDFVFQHGFEFGFQVLTPEVTLAPGEEALYCYYFHSPNAATVGTTRWSAALTPGSEHVILFNTYSSTWTAKDQQPDGTLVKGSSCNALGLSDYVGWVFDARPDSAPFATATDDGTGKPLALEFAPGQPSLLQWYAINTSPNSLTTQVRLTADARGPADIYTQTAAFFALDTSIAIGSGQTGATVSQVCTAPASTFWSLSTRTHQFSPTSRVRNNGGDVVVSLDYAHPTQAIFAPPAFFSFTANQMTQECTYNNPGGGTLHNGDSEFSDEVCYAIGYFFPATHPALCLNGLGPL